MVAMPRKPLIRSQIYPYHVTSRANNREWFFLPQAICWEVFGEKLSIVSERYRAKVLAFVLMSNHFHLLIQTPDGNLDAIMNYLIREVSRTIGARSRRINRIFGGRYKWSLIQDECYIAHVYKYVYRNPV